MGSSGPIWVYLAEDFSPPNEFTQTTKTTCLGLGEIRRNFYYFCRLFVHFGSRTNHVAERRQNSASFDAETPEKHINKLKQYTTLHEIELLQEKS